MDENLFERLKCAAQEAKAAKPIKKQQAELLYGPPEFDSEPEFEDFQEVYGPPAWFNAPRKNRRSIASSLFDTPEVVYGPPTWLDEPPVPPAPPAPPAPTAPKE